MTLRIQGSREVRSTGAPTQSAIWLAITLLIVLAIVVPVTVLAAGSAHPPALVVAIQIVLIVYSSWNLAQQIWTGSTAPLRTVFWIFGYVAVGLAPLCQLATGHRQEMVDGDLSGSWLTAQLVTAAAFLTYSIAYSRQVGRLPNLQPRVARKSRIYLLSCLGVLCSLAYIFILGPGSFFHSREELNDSFLQAGYGTETGGQVGSAILTNVGTVPALMALIVLILHMRHESKNRTVGAYALTVVLIVLNLYVNNPISNSRFWFITVLLGLALCVVPISPITFRTIVIGAIFFASTLFPYSDYYRTNNPNEYSTPATSTIDSLATKDYDQMVMTTNAVTYARESGHTLGLQVLGSAFFWLPRSVWFEKPQDTGVLIGEWMQARNNNLSSPIWTELWLDLSWPGLLIGMYAFAVISRRLDDSFSDSIIYVEPGLHLTRYLAPLLAGYEFIILRGPLLQAMGRLTVMIIVAVAITSAASGQSKEVQ